MTDKRDAAADKPLAAKEEAEMIREAEISPCGRYRYSLRRDWTSGMYYMPSMLFVMLNPSTADGTQDDPTIRRCIAFAKREECGSLFVGNLYSLRATDPAALQGLPESELIGPKGDWWLDLSSTGTVIVAAWGAAKVARKRARSVADRLRGTKYALRCLGVTKDGSPRHPLYVRSEEPLVPYEPK